jgi:hypothetical protein
MLTLTVLVGAGVGGFVLWGSMPEPVPEEARALLVNEKDLLPGWTAETDEPAEDVADQVLSDDLDRIDARESECFGLPVSSTADNDGYSHATPDESLVVTVGATVWDMGSPDKAEAVRANIQSEAGVSCFDTALTQAMQAIVVYSESNGASGLSTTDAAKSELSADLYENLMGVSGLKCVRTSDDISALCFGISVTPVVKGDYLGLYYMVILAAQEPSGTELEQVLTSAAEVLRNTLVRNGIAP